MFKFMHISKFHVKKSGISIVEIIVASAIIAISVVGIVGAIQVYMEIVFQNSRETQAVLLLEETSEALQFMRDDSFSENFASLNPDTSYTIYWTGDTYQVSTSTVALNYDMTRTFVLEEVKRDGSDQISSTGTTDVGTYKAIITIEWPYKEESKTLTSEVLIHNAYDN